MPVLAFNQESTHKHELGLSAGVTTGKGISYRYWANKSGFQITTIPPLLENGKFSYFNSGVSYLYTLANVREGRFYTYLSGSYEIKYDYYVDYIYYPGGGYAKENYFKYETINAGLGLGFDIYMGKYLGLNLQGGYGLVDFLNGVNTTFAAEIGLYFKFPSNLNKINAE